MGSWTTDILPMIMETASYDKEHRQLLQRCRELEAEYSRVMETLPPEQRDWIDAYLTVCMQVDLRMIELAFQFGLARGKKPHYYK